MSLRALLVLWLLAASPALAADAGRVSRLQGEAVADGRPLSVGESVAEGQTLSTGPEARLEVELSDGTRLTLGERAQLSLDRFIYDSRRQDAVLRVTKGAFRVITGAIAKQAGRPFLVQTVAGTIGVRGTDFWGGPLTGEFDLLLIEGAVQLETPRGRQLLDAPGIGVSVAEAGQAPTTPGPWDPSRIAAAVATVSFR